MTVIVSLEKDGVVYMGADTCTSTGKRKENVAQGEFGKITIMPNGLFVGIAGLVSAHQLLTAHPEFFSFADDKLTKDGIIRSFLPQVIALFKEKKEMEEDDVNLPISLLLAKEADLFVITSSLKVFRVRDFAIGSGGSYAFAALRDESETVENRLLNGMRLAEKFETGVSAPFVLVDTKEKTFKEVRE